MVSNTVSNLKDESASDYGEDSYLTASVAAFLECIAP